MSNVEFVRDLTRLAREYDYLFTEKDMIFWIKKNGIGGMIKGQATKIMLRFVDPTKDNRSTGGGVDGVKDENQ